MNKLARYIIIAVSIAAVAFVIWYFSSIVWYIVVAAVFSLIGKPLVTLMRRIHIGSWQFPTWLAATITLIVIFGVLSIFLYSMLPLLSSQFESLRSVDFIALSDSFAEPIEKLNTTINRFLPSSMKGFTLQTEIDMQVSNFFSVTLFKNIFSSTASFLGNFSIFLFSVAFITFFFLKDDQLLFKGFSMFFPVKYEDNLKRAMESIDRLLRRFFVGLLIQCFCVITLTTIGLLLVRLPFKTAITIGLLSGILNVIPYVGAIFSYAISLVIPLALYINGGAPMALPTLMLFISIVFLAVRFIDNGFLQPYIFASSAKAHPLEIFIILLMAGSLAGMLGLLLAVPIYTVIRVFAKEFFNNFRIVQRLTENM